MDLKDQEALNNFKGMTVGQIFIAARNHQNLHISQIAAHLNISTPHLEAIESDDKDSLPPRVYAVGFVRAYADVLGLDSEKMAYLFKLQFYGSTQSPLIKKEKATPPPTSPVSEMMDRFLDRYSFYALPALGFALLLAMVLFLFWLFGSSPDEESSMTPPVPQEMTDGSQDTIIPSDEIVTPPKEPISIIIKPDVGARSFGAEPLDSALIFKAIAKSWIEIRPVVGGKALLSRTLDAGDVFYTPKDTDVLVTTGNAGGIEVYLDGQKLGALGKKAEIIRLRPFSVEALRLQNTE